VKAGDDRRRPRTRLWEGRRRFGRATATTRLRLGRAAARRWEGRRRLHMQRLWPCSRCAVVLRVCRGN
jgi:hypothetical protein